MPEPGELFDLDLFFVDIFQWPDPDEKPNQLTSGSHEFGTLKCPFVIPAEFITSKSSLEVVRCDWKSWR